MVIENPTLGGFWKDAKGTSRLLSAAGEQVPLSYFAGLSDGESENLGSTDLLKLGANDWATFMVVTDENNVGYFRVTGTACTLMEVPSNLGLFTTYTDPGEEPLPDNFDQPAPYFADSDNDTTVNLYVSNGELILSNERGTLVNIGITRVM